MPPAKSAATKAAPPAPQPKPASHATITTLLEDPLRLPALTTMPFGDKIPLTTKDLDTPVRAGATLVRVRVLELAFAGDTLRHPGDVFDLALTDPAAVPVWAVRVDAETPLAAAIGGVGDTVLVEETVPIMSHLTREAPATAGAPLSQSVI